MTADNDKLAPMKIESFHPPDGHEHPEKPEVITIENTDQSPDPEVSSLTHGYVPDTAPRYTKEEEAAVIRKLDFNLIPLLFLLYSLSVLDRTNLGNARIAGMTKDIDLGGTRYNWLGTIFYISCKLTSVISHYFSLHLSGRRITPVPAFLVIIPYLNPRNDAFPPNPNDDHLFDCL